MTEPVYDLIQHNPCGIYIDTNQNGKWGTIDLMGKVVLEPKFEEVVCLPLGKNSLSEDVYVIKAKLDGKWGLFDVQGRTIVEAKYDDIKEISWGFFGLGVRR
jgi:hypothetical protein